MVETAHLATVIHGHVQGVFFRAFVAELCREMELSGYVRNLPDGTVEVKAEGDKPSLEKLLIQLKAGPPGARVDKAVTAWTRYTGNYSGFKVRT